MGEIKVHFSTLVKRCVLSQYSAIIEINSKDMENNDTDK